MKRYLGLILFLLPFASHAQSPADKEKSETAFTEVVHGITYQYSYIISNHRITDIARRFVTGNKVHREDTRQIFVLMKGALVHANESIVYTYNQRDSIFWSGNYTFDHGKLTDLTTTGHGKSEDDNWNPEQEVLANYRDVLSCVKRYQQRTKSAVSSEQVYKEYYNNHKLKAIRHEGYFGGCHMPVGTDSVYSVNGQLMETIFYNNVAGASDDGCHATWTVEMKQSFYPNGTRQTVAQMKHVYEGTPCACGSWKWYDVKGRLIKQINKGKCYDQHACKEE